MTAPATTPAPVRTRAFVFEATFLRGMELTPELETALRGAGFDPGQMQVDYPEEVFLRCLDAVHRVAFPQLSRQQAHWELGKKLVQGFGDTLLGKVLMPGLPLLGPMRLMRRWPSFLKMDDTSHQVTFEELGPRHAVLHWSARSDFDPSFTCGVVEQGLRLARVEPAVAVTRRSATDFDIEAKW